MSVRQIHGYEILIEIGQGGMSRVYLAFDSEDRRPVAIKMLPSEYQTDLGYRSRFEQEARLIAALEHEAIVPLYEYGVEAGRPYIVMQYMPGGSLADQLLPGALSPEQAGRILSRIASALDYAHSRGIIHRDLKTSNILFDQQGGAYLADFGIAIMAESTWQRNLASGTPAYMSPEQALREEAIDIRSDVYSLGIIVFEMLTGRLPFEGDLPASVVLQHLQDPIPALSTLNPDLPAALDPVISRALAKDRRERFASAGEFREAFLDALQSSEGVTQASDTEKPAPAVHSVEKSISQPMIFGTGLTEIRPHEPVSREFVFPPGKKPSRMRSIRGKERMVYMLSLVTWLAVLLASFTAVAARSQVLFPDANLLIVYDETALAVVNVSALPIDFSRVIFQRLTDQGTIAGTFAADEFSHVNPGALMRLPAGDCLQLVRSGTKEIQLIPGAAPAKPPACDRSQGWLVAIDNTWHFWLPQGDGVSFRVIQDGQMIHTCRIADGRCEFLLPEGP